MRIIEKRREEPAPNILCYNNNNNNYACKMKIMKINGV